MGRLWDTQKDGAHQKIGEHHLLQIWVTKISQENNLKTQTKSLFHRRKNVVDFHLSFFAKMTFSRKKMGDSEVCRRSESSSQTKKSPERIRYV